MNCSILRSVRLECLSIGKLAESLRRGGLCREEMGMRYKVVYKILFMNWPLAFTCLYCKWPGRAWPVFAGRSWPRISAQLGRFGEMKEGSEAAALVGDSGLRAAASEWICRMMDAGWEALTPFCGGYPDRLSERLAANAPRCYGLKVMSWRRLMAGARLLGAADFRFQSLGLRLEAERLLPASGLQLFQEALKAQIFRVLRGALHRGVTVRTFFQEASRGIARSLRRW